MLSHRLLNLNLAIRCFAFRNRLLDFSVSYWSLSYNQNKFVNDFDPLKVCFFCEFHFPTDFGYSGVTGNVSVRSPANRQIYGRILSAALTFSLRKQNEERTELEIKIQRESFFCCVRSKLVWLSYEVDILISWKRKVDLFQCLLVAYYSIICSKF